MILIRENSTYEFKINIIRITNCFIHGGNNTICNSKEKEYIEVIFYNEHIMHDCMYVRRRDCIYLASLNR